MRRLFARDRDRPSIEGYEDLELIGSGGFSRVYRAVQPAFDRPVAIKVISVEVAGDIGRFADELRITGRLEGHPNVIRVYESGRTSDGRPFLSMELFEQGSYGTWLRRHGPLRVPDVLSAGVKLAGALQAAQDRSVIHRDVKPQNILRSPFVGPVLADFGIAGLLERRGAVRAGSESEAFSVLHAAPEVLAGERATASSDLYSLASSLYELLTGRPPFHDAAAPGVLEVLARVDAGEVAPIARPDLPAAAGDVIVSLLARNPADRPASGIELASRLQALEADLGLPPTEVPGYEGAGAGRFRRAERPRGDPAGTAEHRDPAPAAPNDPPPHHDAGGNDAGGDDASTHTLLPGASPPPAPPTDGPSPPVPPGPVSPRTVSSGDGSDATDTVRRRPPGPVQRPADEEPPAPRRWPRRLAIGLLVVLAATAAVLGIDALIDDGDDTASPTTTTTTAGPSTTTTTTVPAVPPACPGLDVAPVPEPAGPQPAPGDLAVEATGGGLELSWEDRTAGAAAHVVLLQCERAGAVVTTPVASTPSGTTSTVVPVALEDGRRWCVSVGSVQPGEGTRLPDGEAQFVCVES